MEKAEIRPARLSDAEAIARLCSDDLGYACTASFVRRKLAAALENPCARVFVAEAGGAVAGYIHAADYDVLYFDTMKNVLGLAVSADCRRQGIGAALLGAVEAWARETGACGVRLNSGMTRTGAHDFYRRNGYTREKAQMRFIKTLAP